MFETIRNAWKIKDLRMKLIYTFIMLIVFRLGSCIPVPLLDPNQLKAMFEGTNNSLFGFIDLVHSRMQQSLLWASHHTSTRQLLCSFYA